eukprot:TRINITY_DN99044_c0_g1_i1.p1 TRINITY_DN99044_c0_g1~~TRINITY_DN99044_c0_g1_i1.p1  ORF type:complete len:127 (+),score=26.20 TRINITY_DN99044_c0_g1_i1:169-549(+)
MANALRKASQLQVSTEPYRPKRSGVIASHILSFLFFISLLSLYFIAEAPVWLCAVSLVAGWMLTSAARFLLLQASAFEVWHDGILLYSGIDKWRAPALDELFVLLKQRGVEVNWTPAPKACGASGG